MIGDLTLAACLRRALAAWALGWHPRLGFTAAELQTLGERLYRLAVEVAGEPQDEEHVTDLEGVEEWAVQAAGDGLARHLKRLADGLGEPRERPIRWTDEREDPPVTLGRWESRLDLSEASSADLATLPGVGSGLAAGIVALREAGFLRKIEDLFAVPGLGPKKLAALRSRVYVSEPSRPGLLSTAALDAFRRRPTISAYVDLLVATGGEFVTAMDPSAAPGPGAGPGGGEAPVDSPASLRSAVLREVGRAVAAAAADPPPGGGGRPITAEEAARLGRLTRRARQLVGSAAVQIGTEWAGLVNGPAYRDLALRLINGAAEQIVVVMFFMTYVPGRDHPTNALVEGLVAARRRGVRVSVVLDLDRPEDVFGSRLVNEAAYRFLAAGGVDVTWDRPERLTHTKALIVDGRDVLVGSHNWTAGSFHAYDDKSLVVRSPALAEALTGIALAVRGGR